MNTCPNCNRHLLSHSSATCNWCGHVIEDAAYQAEAEIKRDVFLTQAQLYHGSPLLGPQLTDSYSPPLHPAIERRMDAEVEMKLRRLRALKATPASRQPDAQDVDDGDTRQLPTDVDPQG